MMFMDTYDGKIKLALYMTNRTDNTVNVEDLINKYFDITTLSSNDRLIWKFDDMKKRIVIGPHKNSAATFVSTNNGNYAGINSVMVKVKDNISTNNRLVEYKVY